MARIENVAVDHPVVEGGDQIRGQGQSIGRAGGQACAKKREFVDAQILQFESFGSANGKFGHSVDGKDFVVGSGVNSQETFVRVGRPFNAHIYTAVRHLPETDRAVQFKDIGDTNI